MSIRILSLVLLHFLVYPESAQVEAGHPGAAAVRPCRAELRVVTFQPRLTEGVGHWLYQRDRVVLPRDVFIGVPHNLLYFSKVRCLLCSGQKCVKNRIVYHIIIGAAALLKNPQIVGGGGIVPERPAGVIGQLVVFMVNHDKNDPVIVFHGTDLHVNTNCFKIKLNYLQQGKFSGSMSYDVGFEPIWIAGFC